MIVNLRRDQAIIIGKVLRRHRLKIGFTQVEVSRFFELPPKQISHWEIGKEAPSIHLISKLIRYYNLTLEQKESLKKLLMKEIQISICTDFKISV